MGAANFSGAGLMGRIDKKIRIDQILSDLSANHIDIESYFSTGQFRNAFQLEATAVLVYVDTSTTFAELDVSLQMDVPDQHAAIPLACGVWHPMAVKRIYKTNTTANLRIYLGGIRVI